MDSPKVKFKRSSVANKRPSLSNLESGELALNTYDGKLFTVQDTGGIGIGTTVTLINPWQESYGGGTITYSGNVNITGGIDVTGHTETDTLNVSGIATASSFSVNDNVNISGISITTSSASQSAVDTFSATDFRSASYQIQITRGTEYHVTSLNTVHDGTDVYVTEFGTINTGTILATFAADINSGNVRILATPSSATSTVFKMYRNLIKA